MIRYTEQNFISLVDLANYLHEKGVITFKEKFKFTFQINKELCRRISKQNNSLNSTITIVSPVVFDYFVHWTFLSIGKNYNCFPKKMKEKLLNFGLDYKIDNFHKKEEDFYKEFQLWNSKIIK